ncbi:probable ribonuclease ZC3H12B isoform X1 [Argiope bruennichi]|uniref:probable ribonuclease ZC3H12B isoform X1 n=1 Tax=Argiope bruennichi TaxID=94029 RepID=UPI0024954A17|nr:probable ribonuclease ZC3H12B isoform X1 [Argiope bruennichi]
MCDSITLYLPRTKCENVRVLFSRIRLLFGVSVDPAPDSFQEQEPPGQRNVMVAPGKLTSECSQFKLSVLDGSLEQLNKAKDYLLAACSDSTSRCERRCQYVPDIFQQLVPMRDEVERESSAVVRFEVPENQVLFSGQERCILAAQRFLDQKAQDIVLAKSRGKPSESMGEMGVISQVGTQSREVFRQGRNLESEDSSYDSDCEVADSAGTPQSEQPGGGSESYDPHHDDVSRTVSDTLGAEFAEYVTRDPVEAVMSDPNYTGRVEFALKLGYTEKQVQTALQKLGPQPSQNELLAELIRLGASATFRNQSPSGTSERTDDTIDHFDGGVSGRADGEDPSNLRHIVIDGSNVAMSHGNKEVFSCRGIQICVDWFRARGHKNITVFVPRWRKENSRPDAPCTEQEILAQLEKERMLVFTPSRHVGGRRLVCYDDRYILRLAVESDGIVVSNDNYRDLASENPEFKRIVEDRLLMYSFVNDRFMPPDDPLGRHGPSLDNFLRKTHCPPRTSESLPPPCPYGKKCTYGNKCKYYHPERGNQPQKSVTERLAEQAKIPLQEVKSRGLKSRESSPGDKLKSSVQMPSSTKAKKQPLSRTKSLVPSSALPGNSSDKSSQLVERTKSDGSAVKQDEKSALPKMGNPYGTPYGPPWSSTTMPQISLTTDSSQRGWATIPTTLPHNIAGSCAEMFLEPDGGGGHLFVAKRLSDPDNKAMKNLPSGHQPPEMTNLHRKLQRQLTLNPAYDPRLVQLGGYMDRSSHSLVSQPQENPAAWSRTDRMIPRSNSQENVHLLQSGYGHVPLGRLGSDGSRVAGNFPMASPHLWDTDPSSARLAMAPEHQTVTRIASAPDSCHQWPPSARMQHLNSTSDTRLNLYPDQQMNPLQLGNYPEMQQQRHWLSQSHGLDPPRPMMGSSWQEQSPSGIARGTSQVLSQPVRPSSVPPPGLIQTGRPASPDFCDGARHRLYFHLASIFPKEQVQTVMEMYPQETNPQKICAAILSMFPKG